MPQDPPPHAGAAKAPARKRQLVICLDGTGNRFGDRPTNVVRLYRSLGSGTLAYYDQGVGTFGLQETLFEWQKLPAKVCGLAFGWGIRRIVHGAYQFLAQHYQPGDEIYLFGFSRGAYAARALAAMLKAYGLMAPHHAHLFDAAWTLLRSRTGPRRQPDFQLMARFRSTFGRKVPVHFLGLFDTVKSIGWIYDPFILPYTANNDIVRTVRHALSLDERRSFFRQHRWTQVVPEGQDVREVWFAGVHSDVGGGYPRKEAALALVPFRWMAGEAIAAGLHVNTGRLRRELGRQEDYSTAHLGPMHESLHGPWWLAEWLPRVAWNPQTGRREWLIGAMPPLGRPRRRTLRPPVVLHESVTRRMEEGAYPGAHVPAGCPVVGADPYP